MKVELTNQTRRGKWQAKLVEGHGVGVIGLGDAPASATEGSRHEVIVTGGGNLQNLVMRWP